MTVHDLARQYPDPPPKNDAAILLKSGLDLVSIPEKPTNLIFFNNTPPPMGPLDPATIMECQKWLDRNQAAFAAVPWNKLENAWIGSGFTNGLGNIIPSPLEKMSLLARFLCINAVLYVEKNQPQDAIESLRRASIIAKTLKNDTLLHFLVKGAIETRISDAIEYLISHANLSDSDLSLLLGFLSVTNTGATRETCLINETALPLEIAKLLQTDVKPAKIWGLSPTGDLIKSLGGSVVYQDKDLLHYLDWNAECLAALDLPMSNAIPELREIDARREEAQKNIHFSIFNVFRKERVSMLAVMPTLPVTRELLRELGIIAHERVTVTALAVERWRLARGGRLPDTLTELAPNYLPSPPIDPFDGQTLRYKRLGKGYVIYSIGEDLMDNGGKAEPPRADESSHYDITFTVGK